MVRIARVHETTGCLAVGVGLSKGRPRTLITLEDALRTAAEPSMHDGKD